MLQKLRESAEGLMGRILAVAIILVMALFGFGAVSFLTVGDPTIAEIGDREIGENQLRVEIERDRVLEVRRMGSDYDPDAIDEDRLRAGTLQRLVERALRLNAADDIGIAFPESLVDVRIAQEPGFADENGRFDVNRYQLIIGQLGFTPASFRQEYQAQLTEQTLISALAASSFMTERELRETTAVLDQARDLAWLTVSAASFRDQIDVSEADIARYYAEHQSEFVEPERVDLEVVTLGVDDFLDQFEPTEDEVRQAYEAEVAGFESAEQRDARHILLTTDTRSEEEAVEMARSLRKRALAGEDFAELARTYSEDPGTRGRGGELGLSGRGTFVPEFERALFDLNEGEISDPVATQYGIHLIQLLKVVTTTPPTFDERREAIREKLRRDRARQAFTERLPAFEDEVYESIGLTSVAERFSLDIERVDNVTRNAGEGLAADERIRKAAFDPLVITGNRNSEVVRLSDDQVAAVHVAAHVPARERPLAEVREEVRAALIAERSRSLAREAAERARASLEGGASAALVAEQVGGEWLRRGGVTRRTSVGIPEAVAKLAFSMAPPAAGEKAIGLADLADGDVAVVTVANVRAGDWAALPEADQTTLATILGNLRARSEVQAFMDALRAFYGVTMVDAS